MIKVGLTGRSGAGKSGVCDILRKKGYFIIDADKISRLVVEKGQAALEEIVAYFGDNILNDDGSLNRRILGDIVFNSREKLDNLNEIIFPHITSYINSLIEKEKPKVVFLDAPTLIESGIYTQCDYIVVVEASDTLCIERLMNRDNITFEQASARLSKQLPREEFKKYANYIIKNNNKKSELLIQIQDMINIFALHI